MAKEIRPLQRYNENTEQTEIFYPATTTDAIAHTTKRKSLTNVIADIETGIIYDVTANNPTAGPNNDGKWESLSALLSDVNLNTLIPTSVRRGGMSIKYVQSSDNKYVQACCTANEFTTDTTQWVIAEEGVYVENPEFVYVKTDKESKILWAIKTDGSIYYGAGVPQQVIDYIEKKLANFSPDDYGDIVAFLNDLEKGDKTLQTLLNEKVDKEEGKSLIDAEYADGVKYVENPEFIKVETDAEDKILHGVRKDGAHWFSKIESPTLDNLQKEVNDAIEESQEALTEHYDYYNVSKHHTIRDVFNIYTANTGWQQVEYDSTAAMYDELDVYQIGEVCNYDGDIEHSYESITSHRGVVPAIVTQEYVTRRKFTLEEAISVLPAEILTAFAAGQIICFVDLDDIVEEWQISESGSWVRVNPYEIKDPEGRVEIKLDNDNKIIAYRKADGTWVECVGIEAPNLGDYVDKEEGKGLIDKDVADSLSCIEDTEDRHEITTDSEGKIISYRKEDGTKVENVGFESPKITTGSLNLSESGMTEFQQALKDSGFRPGGAGNFTDKSSMQIPIPQLAFVNITAPNGNAVWPTSKTNDYHYYMEFYDGAGNYFKKEIFFNAQGRSSMGHPKKNGAADFCNNNGWDDDDTFEIKFGDWITQDSFHFKGYWTDFFRGINVIAYDLANMLWENRGLRADRPWKKALIDFDSIGRDYRDTWNKDNMALQMDNGARCIPDGFPAVFYLNGEFYGVYSWQLKKHRDNYHMKKDNPKHIHLDGVISWTVLFGADGDASKINWSPAEYQGFEVRNPKDVWTVAGNKYDGDLDESQELVDTATAEDWITAGVTPAGVSVTSKIAKQLRYTGKVKKYILDFSKVIPMLKSMKEGGSTDAEIREYFEEHFDVDNIIDYILFSAILYNYDGFSGNWQWTTWDGVKWYICPYDCDGILGQQEAGNYIMNVNARLFKTGTESSSNLNDGFNYPIKWVTTYYKAELAARWSEIKQLGCVDFFMKHLTDWMSRIGQDNYEKEFEKWNTTPSNRDSNVNAEYWSFAGERNNNDSWVTATGKVYDDTKQYSVYSGSESADNTCWFKQGGYYYKFRCVSACVGEKPLDTSKPALGFHDSIWRAQNMIEHLYGGIDSLITNL